MESRDVSPTDRSSNGAAGSAEKDSTLAVKVAVNIRPLIGLERVQGCKDCITVVPGEPQVQLGTHSFTFDHVYGSTGTPLSAIFDECVSPLVDGLFQGFNATVLAYGQTGSGKTYTMGTGYTVGGSTEGIIPKVMETIFAKIETLKAKADFQIRVSFIEILKEEVHDLLDPSPPSTVRADLSLGGAFGDSKYSSGKPVVPGKPPIQIRETTNGGITLAGVTETDVNSLGEMAMCLEQGSLCRATGSTMMNARSSRSHAIFTITVEQRRKWETLINGANPLLEDVGEDFLCAKFHLVDLAGSERAKRTGADGLRFKEGVHINKGLLALGNVISALGDDKKRKEGGHVPYRDSKLTRLLQDSLGGNSRTVMIACVSPADSNAEETLNTLKYANRARNIQNKPTINRDPVAAEMSRMRQQLELMQAELLCARASSAPEEVQLLQQKIAWLENSNLDLRHELQVARNSIQELSQQGLDSRVQQDKLRLKLDQLRAGRTFEEIDGEDDGETGSVLKEQRLRIQELEEELRKLQLSGAPSRPRSALLSLAIGDEDAMSTLSGYSDVITNSSAMGAELPADAGAGAAEDQAKEIEYNLLQENFDKELQELNKRLEQKEAEMTRFVRSDTVVLKQHFERKLVELEEEKKTLQGERDMLANKIEKLTTTSDENAQKMKDTYVQKLKELEVQITDLRKKQENQSQHLRAKERADEAAKRLQDDIHRIKTQKVQLQQKMKQESEQFRMWKACREKELLQLRKEGRRNVYEMHKLQALNQRQKLVLQRKTEEAAMATRRLKEMLEARKSPRDSIGYGFAQNEKNLHQWLEQELEMAVRVHEVRSAYDKQMEERMALAKELASLKEERMNSSINQAPSMSPGARLARLQLLETMLNSSSSALVAMASQLSEAEERERSAGGRARWHSMRSMGDAKSLLQLAFDAAALSRCRIRDTEEEKKELKEKLLETQQLLRRSEDCRQELERLQPTISQPGVSSLTTINMLSFDAGLKKGDNRTYKTAEIRHRTGVENGIPDPVSSRNNTIPYSLRKIGRRDETSSKYALPDQTSNSSEGESDMDTNSDDEWKEDSEKQAVKRNRALGGYSGLSKLQSKSVSLDRKSRVSSSHHGLHSLDEESVEVHEEDNEDPKGSRERCSCKSGCKTKKCKCKAAGGLCGTLCGCIATKCNNREAVAVEEGRSFSVAPPIQVEVAQELALTGVDKNSRRLDGASEAAEHVSGGKSPLHIVTEDEHVTKRAERLLAAHGASLLDSAWNDEFDVSANSNKESQPEERQRDGRVETTDDDKLVPHRHRKPLQDIGNKVSTKGKAGGKRGKQRQTSLVQLVTSGEPPNTGTGTAATTASPAASQPDATAVTAATIHTPTAAAASVIVPATAAAPIAAPCSVVPLAAIPDVTVNPLWRQQSLQRRISTGQVSPLRLRDNKVGAFNSSSGGGGGGTSGDNNVTQAGVVKNPKAATASSATGPGSPSTTGAGRGTDGKENIHRNSFV